MGCAPSLLAHPFADLAAIGTLIMRGWAIVATDYTGLGTRGPGAVPTHTYLVGADEAYAELDALRAARQLDGVRLSGQFVVWGYSQGGHAALWTGILAARYAPELTPAGVAAIAPATDLPRLVQRTQSTLAGRILNGFLVIGYAAAYPDVHFDEVVPMTSRAVVSWTHAP
jgi:hypothetical protein